jgi:NADPH:quinone reductase-like Zn-dependent oxidoreductase
MTAMRRPIPTFGEVLIRVAAIGVNPADAKWRMGMFAQRVPVAFPYVPGYDVAGTIESGGTLAAGTRVLAMLDNRKAGAYAQFVVVGEQAVAQIPDGVDDATAAALPTPALTGVQIVEEHVRPRAGDRVLVTGATGAVGRFAVHAAKSSGAYVIAAVRAEQRQTSMAIGADETLVLGAEPEEALMLDHIVDTVGGAAVGALCRHVRPGGVIKTVATTPIPTDGVGSTPEFVAVHPDAHRLAAIAGWVRAGRVVVRVAHRLPLAEAVRAHHYLDAGSVGGKIILEAWR